MASDISDYLPKGQSGKSILIIAFTKLSRDPRAKRQIQHLSQRHKVTAVGFDDPAIPSVEYIPVSEVRKTLANKVYRALCLKTSRFMAYYDHTYQYAEAKDVLLKKKFDLIIADDNDSLPFAFEVAGEGKVLHDAYEYSPRHLEDRFQWRFLFKGYREWVCANYLSRCDAVTTVSNGIGQEYAKNYGVRPSIITNAPDYVDFQPSPVTEGQVNIIHHGITSRSRRLESMIHMMDHLDERFTLSLMLVPTDEKYLSELKRMARNNDRIRFIDPVPPSEIVRFSNRFDIGLFMPEPTTFNLLNSLPNKFFEFVQSRLAVAVTPLPEMARVVREYDCGIISEDFSPESMANRLNGLDKGRIEYYKQQAQKAAKALSSIPNMETLDHIVDDLTSLSEAGGYHAAPESV